MQKREVLQSYYCSEADVNVYTSFSCKLNMKEEYIIIHARETIEERYYNIY